MNILVCAFTVVMVAAQPIVMKSQIETEQPAGRSDVNIKAEFILFTDQEVRIKASVTNSSRSSLYLVVEPKDRYAREGLYVSFCTIDDSEIAVASKLFPRAFPSPAVDGTRVKLMKLEPGRSHSDTIILKSPLRESMPPAGSFTYGVENGRPVNRSSELHIPQDIHLNKLRSVYVTYGYFHDSPRIESFLRSKSHGWYLLGDERVETDAEGRIRNFLDIQRLATVKLNVPVKN